MFRLTIVSFMGLLSALLGSAEPHLQGAEQGGAARAVPEWEETILRALDKPITLEFKNTSLKDAMVQVEQQAGIPNVLIDVTALNVVDIGTDFPITRSLKNIPLRSALKLILHELDLTYTICDGALVITTPEEAEMRLETKVFDVLDLVQRYDDAPPEQDDHDALIHAITYVIAPTYWVDTGGPGSIKGYRGTLVVSQTRRVLDQISHLLAAIRKGRQILREHGTSSPPLASLPIIGSPSSRKIDDALRRRSTFEFQKTPLADVAAFLEDTFGIQVELHTRSIADAGLAGDLPITFSGKNLTLRQALRHMMKQVDLTYMQQDDVLLITSPEEAEMFPLTRVYPVADLLAGLQSSCGGRGANFEHADYDALDELITATIARTEWISAGGNGSLDILPHGLCLISQTSEIHADVERLFAKLRATMPIKRIAEPQQDEDGLRLVIYLVYTKSGQDWWRRYKPEDFKTDQSGLNAGGATLSQVGGFGAMVIPGVAPFEDQELLELIKELVKPDSWKAVGVYARAGAGRLVIRQTDEVHREIHRMLKRLGVFVHDDLDMKTGRSGIFYGGIGGFRGGGGMF